MVLIDSGSAYSFIDEETTTALQCELQETPSLYVLIANGSQMVSQLKCKEFEWVMSGQEFSANFEDSQVRRMPHCAGGELDEDD